MRNFGAFSGSKAQNYIANNERYFHAFLPALESKFRLADFPNYADSVKKYRGILARTGDEQVARNAAKTPMFTPPSKFEYLNEYQQNKEAFKNTDTAMDWTVRHFVNAMRFANAVRPDVDVSELPAFQPGGAYNPGEARETQAGFQKRAKLKSSFGPARSGGQTAPADEPLYEGEDQSFFQQYKMPIIGALVLLGAGGAYYIYTRM